MAPTSYCYSCVPMDEFPKKLRDRKLPVWVGILLFLLVVVVASQATLMIALQKEKAGGRKQQELVQKLQEEIKTLNQELQEKSSELEQLRKENEALVSAKCPPDSGITLRLSVAAVLLTLSLQALLV
ncbi:PREDICTED: bone marrow stromal antigen 2-like isoform X2 [Myotis brandtii]|uniref:bone marrow stromal antigen 2-like isoform X2 n=1 Tax=Myotis brandtii TaxID=109478 RepID=UPI0007042CE3|nr:PREDICTED: bone marrow stromal antigen 2-like isoform X2 [Myotis brandtii]